jgi:hypothetical protein
MAGCSYIIDHFIEELQEIGAKQDRKHAEVDLPHQLLLVDVRYPPRHRRRPSQAGLRLWRVGGIFLDIGRDDPEFLHCRLGQPGW